MTASSLIDRGRGDGVGQVSSQPMSVQGPESVNGSAAPSQPHPEAHPICVAFCIGPTRHTGDDSNILLQGSPGEHATAGPLIERRPRNELEGPLDAGSLACALAKSLPYRGHFIDLGPGAGSISRHLLGQRALATLSNPVQPCLLESVDVGAGVCRLLRLFQVRTNQT